MKLVILEDFEALSRKAALMVAGRIVVQPRAVIGLATGDSVIGMYSELARLQDDYGLDLSQVTGFNLDEICGLGPSDPRSYGHHLQENLFDKVNLAAARIHMLDGMAPDPHAECIRFEDTIREVGGIDLQILGVGRTGHIAFERPGRSFQVRTGVLDLGDDAMELSSPIHREDSFTPQRALSVGIGTIMNAGEVLLLASGAGKAEVVAASVLSPLDPSIPVSILKLHPRFTLVLDRAAARGLEGKDLTPYI